MKRPHTPLADSYMRARLGLPADFDLDSVPFAHLEFVAAELQRKAEAERKKEAARQKELEALQPPKIIPQFIKTPNYVAGERRISGFASSGAINSHGYALHPGGCKIILPIPLLIAHNIRSCIGSVEIAEITPDGKIRVWANIDGRCDDSTWRRIQSGDLGCFSGAGDLEHAAAPISIHGVDNYYDWRLKEVSLVETGANHECVVTGIWPLIAEAQPSEIVDRVEPTVETIGAQAAVVQSIKELTNIMRKPMKPVYDNDGKLIGAERVDKSFEQHEARLAALEDRLPLAYGGTYSDGQGCKKGLFYTHQGSVWYCKETTVGRPGASEDFVLAVKRGAMGREAR